MTKIENWPEIRDCEGDIIEQRDILLNANGHECRYIVANFDSIDEIGDGSTWRAVDYLREGEDLEAALDRIEKEVNR